MCNLFGIKNEYKLLINSLKTHTYNTNTNKCIKNCSNKGKAGNLGHLSSKAEYYYQTEENYPKSLLYYNRVSNPIHPTQKPVELLEYLIKTYTKRGEIVLDNCMGSGSTGVACQNTDREFIGIELDEKYFNIAKNRLEENESRLKNE